MLFRLFLLFALVPAVELALLIEIGQRIGAGATVGLLILTGILGASLAKYEGLHTWRMIQQDLARGQMPTNRLVDAVLILVAGALLVTPGVLTDAVGVVLLLPPSRRLVRGYLKRRFQARISITHFGGFGPSADDELIDVEARPHDE
jgi:UPF0716 protein FxsA